MKKNKSKALIIILSILVLVIAICFMVLMLKYRQTEELKSNFRIEFLKVNKLNPMKAGDFSPTSEATITNNGLSLDMSFDLYTPNDEITYDVTIKNTGDIKGKIVNIISNPDYTNDDNAAKSIFPVTITQTNIVGKELSPGEETDLKITVTYPNIKGNYNAINIPYQLSLLVTTS